MLPVATELARPEVAIICEARTAPTRGNLIFTRVFWRDLHFIFLFSSAYSGSDTMQSVPSSVEVEEVDLQEEAVVAVEDLVVEEVDQIK